jgi:hypothetical protein
MDPELSHWPSRLLTIRLHLILKTIKLPSTSTDFTIVVYIPEKAMKTPIAAVKSSGAEPPAAMKVAPATSSLIPPAKMRLFYTGAKKSLAAMKVAPATSSLIPPAKMRLFYTGAKNHWQP